MPKLRERSAPFIRCAICGVRLTKKWVYSKSTRNRYCIDIDACSKRARRKEHVQGNG